MIFIPFFVLIKVLLHYCVLFSHLGSYNRLFWFTVALSVIHDKCDVIKNIWLLMLAWLVCWHLSENALHRWSHLKIRAELNEYLWNQAQCYACISVMAYSVNSGLFECMYFLVDTCHLAFKLEATCCLLSMRCGRQCGWEHGWHGWS